MFLLMASVLSAMARAARRRRMLEEQRRLELERQRRGGGEAPSPFAGMPFGGLLEALLGGAMGGANSEFRVERPDELVTFADVGGMEPLKQEIRDTVGLMLEHPDEAERYGIDWNGLLLHGRPGVGKTFFAKAIAGEYRLNFIHVSTGDLVAGVQGQSAKNIDKAFQTALDNLPCVLFFDEFDSVAQRRSDTPDQESRRTVNQLLTSLEAYREQPGLLVMAATNDLEHLDEIVRRTEGMTPAAIAKVVDAAALDVFRDAASSGRQLALDEGHLLAALE